MVNRRVALVKSTVSSIFGFAGCVEEGHRRVQKGGGCIWAGHLTSWAKLSSLMTPNVNSLVDKCSSTSLGGGTFTIKMFNRTLSCLNTWHTQVIPYDHYHLPCRETVDSFDLEMWVKFVLASFRNSEALDRRISLDSKRTLADMVIDNTRSLPTCRKGLPLTWTELWLSREGALSAARYY
ncbi:hypothetical protein CXB51_027718 [Gossypium anomalum]|uniref:Uncharacterized protein n=1 Tax=Gossypium anomalum TaxID=47600 RepID=A0A8J5YB62_9ROSI|nr:hypothetical protein CXB51_027718 [Gossypium anomalum]